MVFYGLCYAMRKPELSRALKDTLTEPERQRQLRLNEQKLKEANEIIEKVPSANMCDEDVAKHLEENECVICLEIIHYLNSIFLIEFTQKGKNGKRHKISLLRGKNEVFFNSFCIPYRHYYHRDCLMAWFKTKTVCPICKNDKILETHLQINVVAELVNVTH